MTGEAIDPSEYQPPVQAGVEYSRPKDLKAADDDHPLYQRALSKGILSADHVAEGKTIPWNVPATVLKNMSDGLYESEEATMREFESNGETACLKVSRGYEDIPLVPDDYQPVIEITHRKDQNKVVIRDNGKGIESATILDVVRKIGATTVRDSGNMTGQFGMGLASFLKLIGLDNSMIGKTHSRITDENYAFYLNLGGFDPIAGGLPKDEYGTEFTMIYPDHEDGGPRPSKIRGYVQTYSEWLRVPVHFEEYDEDGKFEMDEDWGGQTFEETYDDSAMVVTLEVPGLLTAALSGDSTGTTLLNSMPIDRNDGNYGGTKKFECPHQFDVRIEDESGAVVFVPDDLDADDLPQGCETPDDLVGLTPVSDAEYNIMSAAQKKIHVRESDLPANAMTLPVPTSSRDSLQQHDAFWEALSERLADAFFEKVQETFFDYDGVNDLLKAHGRELQTAVEGLNAINYGHGRSLQEAVKDEYDVTLGSDVAAALEELTEEVRAAFPGRDVNVNRLTSANETSVGQVAAHTHSRGGTAYMAVDPSQTKADIVFDMGRDPGDPDEESANAVVELDSSDKYEKYAELFGWKELRDIRMSNLHEYPISDALYDNILDQMGVEEDDEETTTTRAPPTPPEEEELNLSFGRNQDQQRWVVSRTIKDALTSGETVELEEHGYRGSIHQVNAVILCPSNSDRNISDYYWLAGYYGDYVVALANCNVSTYEYLKDAPGIHHIDDFAEQSWRQSIETTAGTTNVAHSRDELVLHTVTPEAKSHLQFVMADIPTVLRDLYTSDTHDYFGRRTWDGPDLETLAYAPVTMEEMFWIAPAVRDAEVTVIWGSLDPHCISRYAKMNIQNDLWLYARARLSEWPSDSLELEAMSSYDFDHDLTDGGYELVENMAERHDLGMPPVSER